MRLSTSARLPHPVLGGQSTDYPTGEFVLDLEIEEHQPTGHIWLNGNLKLECASIAKLLQEGQAAAGLMITCQDTYCDRFEECDPGEVRVELKSGQVRGLVQVRGVIVATRHRLSLSAEAVNAEFPADSLSVGHGALIALTDELRFEAGLEKLAPLESIFMLKPNEDVRAGCIEVSLDSEAVEIHAAPALFEFISVFRDQPMRDTLLASFYLPVVMQVLEAMRTDDLADRRWFGIMRARCNAEGIDPDDDLILAAQRLLDAPLREFQSSILRFGS
jgi:hypothetical protein